MKHFYSQIKNFINIALFLGIFMQSYLAHAQGTTLGVGDIIFTGYDSTPVAGTGDLYSFIVLTNISAGTIISFTDRGYNGSSWQAIVGSTEGTVTWTSATAIPMGTEILINGLTASTYNTGTSTLTANGVVTLTEGTPVNGLSLSNVGDQIVAFQGGSGSITGAGASIKGGLSYGTCNVATTTAATWDVPGGSCTIGPSTSAMPPGIANGTSAFYTGTLVGGAVPQSSKFTGTGPFANAAAIKTAVMNPANWSFSATTQPMPSAAPFVGVPPTVTNPPNRTLCVGGSTTFPVTATDATSYQWQVNTGSGFTNITNGAPYSNATTATLTVSPVTGTMSGYQYRCTVNGAGSVSSASGGTLTVSNITVTTTVQTNVSCKGGTNGSVTLSASGGIGPYTYSSSPSGISSATATGLSAGTYTVTVTDDILCSKTHTVIITEPLLALSGATATTPVSCFGGSNGTATVTASGGTSLYTYLWSNGATTATATGLIAGTNYSVTITDSKSCTFTISNIAVGQPTAILDGTATTTPVSCFGGTNGTATVVASGGNSGYTYVWSPTGGTGDTASGLAAGTYSVVITDSKSCTKTVSTIVVSGPSAALNGTTSTTPVSCSGGANGTATVVATGGTSGYSYLWSNGATTATASGLISGNYTVTITDSKTCTKIINNINVGSPALFDPVPTQVNVSCNGGSNGSATVTPTGGAGGYTYLWSNGGTTSSITGLTQGTYTVTITDANTCQKTQSFTITEPPLLVASKGTINNVSCNGGSNGSATVVASGGTIGYSYTWSPSGGNGATASGLPQGTYTATVTDAKGCTATQTFEITQPSPFSVTTSQTNILCNGAATGSATVNVTGGTGTHTYLWSPAGGTAATASGLIAGTYTVTISDENTCSTTRTFTIGEQPQLVASAGAITNINCRGDATGSATVNVTGGTGLYTYSWAPSGGTAATASGLTAGTYTVTVTDANLCTTTQSFTITQPAAVLSATTASTRVSCFGGSNGAASVTVSGGTPGYTYSWAPLGGTTSSITGRPAGNYTCTITDNKGCTLVKNITIATPAAFSATVAQTNVSCNGGTNASATITPSGATAPFNYSWSPFGGNAATATGLSAGTYTVTVQDANTCVYTVNLTITEPLPLTVTPSQTNVLCNGGSTGSATVTAAGGTPGYTYVWSPAGGTGATATGLTTGNYSCLVTDNNGCTFTQNFNISQPAILNASTSKIDATCIIGGQASVTPVGGTTPYTYLWSPSGATTQTVTGLAAGNHSVLLTDGNGCTLVKNFTINTTNTLVATTSQTNVLCNGSNTASASVTPSGAPGPFIYVWAPSGGNTATASNLTAGNYSVTINSANGCSIVKTFTITEPSPLVVTPSQTNLACNGGTNGSASVNVTGGTGSYNYLWAPTGGIVATATGLSAGTYTVTVTDANLCSTTQSFTITQPAALTASLTSTNVNCNGGSNGAATVTTTGGTGAYTYVWSPTGGTAATASGLTAGTYTVTVTDANSCTHTETVTITEPAQLTASIGNQNDVSCNGENNGSATVNVIGGTGTYTYVWSPSGGTAATASGLNPGNYTVTVTDTNNCTTSQDFVIAEPAQLVASPGSQNNVSCNGGTNGTASVNVIGGNGGYTYSWSPSGGSAAVATGLSAGTYTVTVTDANLCSTTQSFTITQPAALTASVTSTNVNCNGGSNGAATVTASGGTGAYSYVWSPTGGTAATASGLTAGTYTVTVTDANACTKTETVTITEPITLTATVAQTNVTCIGTSDGSATVNATGGTGAYTYLWSPTGGSDATATGLTAGNYTVTISDVNGCQVTKPVSILTTPDVTLPVPDVATLPAITSTCSIVSAQIPVPTATDNCAGIINATTTDPLNYTAVGSYVIKWSYDDGHGNISTQNQTVIVTASPLDQVTFSNAAYTFDGNLHALQIANLPVGANVTYSITPTASTQNGAINAGIYTVTAIVSPSASTPNCTPITLTAQLTINKAAQQITFGAIPAKILGAVNNFNLEAAANSGLPIRYSFTYTSTLPPANVSALGLVNMLRSGDLLIVAHQDGNANYLPAADVSQILVIKNNDVTVSKITLGNKVFENPAKELKYLMECGENNVNVVIVNQTNAIFTPSSNFTITPPKPGIYTQNIGITSEDGSTTANYTIIVEKPFGFYDIVHQKFNNLLLINNNPQTNGGYEFVSYQWFKNGQLVGTGQYYSAGDDLSNSLDTSADFSVKMTTKDGKILQTCSTKITAQNSLTAKLYPNPIQTGQVVTVEADFPSEELENMQISLYSVSGQLIKTLKSSTVKTEVQLPQAESNMYVVVIETPNIKKTLKIIVNK